MDLLTFWYPAISFVLLFAIGVWPVEGKLSMPVQLAEAQGRRGEASLALG